MRDFNSRSRGNALAPNRRSLVLYIVMGLLDKGYVIKRIVVCNEWDLEP